MCGRGFGRFICLYLLGIVGNDQTTEASIPSRMNGVNNNIYKSEIRGPAEWVISVSDVRVEE